MLEKPSGIQRVINRNGHTIEFDDAEESLGITIKDKNGNSIFLDTKGKNIEITAPETITMKAKNIEMNADENITSSAGKDIMMNAENDTNVTTGKEMNFSADTIFMDSITETSHSSDKYEVTANKTRIDSTQENLELASNKEVDLQSAKKVRLF